MSEATTDRALAGNEEEEEVLPPQPTTKSIILGEVVGCFLLKRFAPSNDRIGAVLAAWRYETNRLPPQRPGSARPPGV
jgi:hypothetical protein